MRVARQVMSTTRPVIPVSASIQSPIRYGRSMLRAMPENRSPMTFRSANPMIATRIPDVASAPAIALSDMVDRMTNDTAMQRMAVMS